MALDSNENNLAVALGKPGPTHIVTVTGELTNRQIEDITETAHAVEIRADMFERSDADYLIGQIGRFTVPTLFTIRTRSQGGKWRGTQTQRLELFEEVVSHVDGMDIERTAPIRSDVTDLAQQENSLLIVSNHNNKGTPLGETLEKQLQDARGGANWVKIVSRADTIQEFQRQARFTMDHNDENLIVMATGQWSMASRATFWALGSDAVYSSADDIPAALGQPNYLGMGVLLDEVIPASMISPVGRLTFKK